MLLLYGISEFPIKRKAREVDWGEEKRRVRRAGGKRRGTVVRFVEVKSKATRVPGGRKGNPWRRKRGTLKMKNLSQATPIEHLIRRAKKRLL